MEREVVISPIARKKLMALFEYLEGEWSEKVKLNFISKLERSISLIKQNPELYPKSSQKKGLRKCVISKQTTIYYMLDNTAVNIVTVFDNRQDPDKLVL